LGRLWRGPGSHQCPEEQALGISAVSSKLPFLAAQLRKEMNFPVRVFRCLPATLLRFKEMHWEQSVNKLVNSVACIK